MRGIIYSVLFIVVVATLSGCAAFFEDYSYAPMTPGTTTSGY